MEFQQNTQSFKDLIELQKDVSLSLLYLSVKRDALFVNQSQTCQVFGVYLGIQEELQIEY